MRVLQVHWTFPPTTGGVESHLADLSVGLADRGCDVTVLTGEPRPEPRTGVRLVSTPLLDLEKVRSGRWENAEHLRALMAEVEPLVEQLRPDVVHGHNLHHFAAAPALVLDALAQRHGFVIHHTFHETWPDVLHEQPVYRGWAGNYAVSDHVRRECARRIGFSPELRPLGIDVTRFDTRRPALQPGARPVILHPARLLPWKGVHTSVEAIARLRRQGQEAELVITDTARIADWDGQLTAYRRSILDLIQQLGVADLCTLQPAAYHEMPALYERADVVVYPTVADEPYGLVPLEAMSCRRPIVASRCGGLVETILDGSTGWLIQPENAAQLADRLQALTSNPEAARAMGDAGRQHVTNNFSLRAYVDAMLEAYRAGARASAA